MPLINDFDTAVELAGKILLKKGRISLKDIRYVPFVESELEAMAVAQNLIDKYDVKVVDDKWNGDIILHLQPSTDQRIRDWQRRRRERAGIGLGRGGLRRRDDRAAKPSTPP